MCWRGGGNRAVEFFFLISGYLTASTCISNKLHSTEAYMWHRIKPLLLPLWISWIVSFAGYHLIKVHTDLVTTAKDALASIFELLFLQNAITCDEDSRISKKSCISDNKASNYRTIKLLIIDFCTLIISYFTSGQNK